MQNECHSNIKLDLKFLYQVHEWPCRVYIVDASFKCNVKKSEYISNKYLSLFKKKKKFNIIHRETLKLYECRSLISAVDIHFLRA